MTASGCWQGSMSWTEEPLVLLTWQVLLLRRSLTDVKNSEQSYACINGKRWPKDVAFTMLAQREGKLCINPLFPSLCWLLYQVEALTRPSSSFVEGLQNSSIQQVSGKLWLTEHEAHTLKEQWSENPPRGKCACEIFYKRLYNLHIVPPLVIMQDSSQGKQKNIAPELFKGIW